MSTYPANLKNQILNIQGTVRERGNRKSQRIPAVSVNRGFDEQWKGPGKVQGILADTEGSYSWIYVYVYIIHIYILYIYMGSSSAF